MVYWICERFGYHHLCWLLMIITTLPMYSSVPCNDIPVPSFFLPFGTANGDRQHDETTDLWDPLTSTKPFQIGSKAYNKIRSIMFGEFKLVCDGCISYDISVAKQQYQPPDHANGEDLFDRIVEDEATLQQLSNRVIEAEGCAEFVATTGYIVTWRCITTFGEEELDEPGYYTFQAGLVSDGTVTYIIINHLSIPSESTIYAYYNYVEDYFLKDYSYAGTYGGTNFCNSKQWVFQAFLGSVVTPAATPVCVCPLEWSAWIGQCSSCGGCGTRTRSRSLTDNSVETVNEQCPPKRCKRGVHRKREWLRSKKGKLFGRFRRCCWNWLRPERPVIMRFSRRCKARRCRGWE